MKRMFATQSKTTPPDKLSTFSPAVQPPSPQPVPPTSDEDVVPQINEDLDGVHYPRPGFHDFISDHTTPAEDDEPLAHTSFTGKLALVQLYNFENHHWVELYSECAKRSYEEELALYDLLNEDAATGDGMEVDVDETTADILFGLLYHSFSPTLCSTIESRVPLTIVRE